MNHWNKTGRIKAIILGVVALPNLLAPTEAQGQEGIEMTVTPLVFGAIAIPLIAKFNEAVLRRELVRPAWNDNPLNLRRPLAFFHFSAAFFLTAGLSMLVGVAISSQTLSSWALTLISFGIGISLGIRIAMRWAKASV